MHAPVVRHLDQPRARHALVQDIAAHARQLHAAQLDRRRHLHSAGRLDTSAQNIPAFSDIRSPHTPCGAIRLAAHLMRA